MPENQNFDMSYMIMIESKTLPVEIVKLLKENGISFKGLKCFNLKEEKNEGQDIENVNISIPVVVYDKIAELCNIMNWPPGEKITKLLETAVNSAEVVSEGGFKKIYNF